MKDLRQAVSAWRATPMITAVALLSIALGIGASAAIFSIVNGLLLRSLPVREPERLVLVADAATRGPQPWNYAIWEEIRRRPELFERSAAWWFGAFTLRDRGETRLVEGLCVSGAFFDTLGVPVALGRALTDADDQRAGGPDGPVAVIGHRFWQEQLNGSPDAIGRGLVINNVSFTIVGVAPEYFFGPEPGRQFDVIVPLNDEPIATGLNRVDNRDWTWLTIIGRLRPGQSSEAVEARLRGLRSQIREATIPNLPTPFLDQYLREGFVLTPAAMGDSSLRRRFERPLWTIMVVVFLVQLITSANIANVLLARFAARRHEFSVRRALGASSWRLMRQFLVESLFLAGIGAGFGTLVASWATRVLVRQLSTQTSPVFLDVSVDWRVVAFTAGITLATALLFGVSPAIRACRVDPIHALRERGSSAGRETLRMTTGVVVAQVALSVVIVVVAGLFVRSFTSLTARPLGFAPEQVLVVTIDAQHAGVDPDRWIALYEEVQAAVRALPGVADASLSAVLPGSANVLRAPVEVRGGVPLPPTQRMTVGNLVSSEWFSKFGPPIVAGRALDEGDRKHAPLVAVVNQTFARRFINGASPLGRTFALPEQMAPATDNNRIEIVGVVADAVVRSLREPIGPAMYLPLAQHDGPFFRRGFGTINLGVRARSGSPMLLTRTVAAAIASINPALSLTFRPLTDQVNASLVQERLVATLSVFFGGLALLLAGIGLYGVTSFAVSRRRVEIGIRMALGATRGRVVRMVMARALLLVGLGLAIGGSVSVWASQFVAALLYGLEPRDPVTLVGAASALAAVGAVAAWLPAWRASRIDPARTLREG